MAELPVLKDVAKLDNCVTVIDACNFESTFYTGKVQKLILMRLFQTVKIEFLKERKKDVTGYFHFLNIEICQCLIRPTLESQRKKFVVRKR